MKAIYPPRLLLGLPLVLALAACSAALPPVPTPPAGPVNPGLPRPTPPATPRPSVDWRDLTVMAGEWRWSREGSLSVARFSLPNGTERISLTCDPVRKSVTLRQPSFATGEQPVTITTTSTRRVVTGQGSNTTPYVIAVTFAASDPLLDDIAFSRGRFMIEHGTDWSIAPSHPEVSRVIEDCR